MGFNDCDDAIEDLSDWHLEFLLISVAVCLIGALLVNPLIIFIILLKNKFRQETRYLLLANLMLSDLVFLCLNSCVSITLTICYCSAILTITLMAIDTFLAVSLPLRYISLMPPSRTIKLLIVIWVVASVYPIFLLVVILVVESYPEMNHQSCLLPLALDSKTLGNGLVISIHIFLVSGALVCLAVIIYCYVMLYYNTKRSGIWDNLYSRARVTLLIHTTLFFLYFAPGLFLVWLSSVNSEVFMMLPRMLCPYLYGLRYRDIAKRIKRSFLVKQHSVRSMNAWYISGHGDSQ
uniref:G-protein coupled receptors family 1 profile domain-containing protein n=1 Tax=Callorhinchus milii TaxID=7868 RepID=A0A4W3I0A3_CALMI